MSTDYTWVSTDYALEEVLPGRNLLHPDACLMESQLLPEATASSTLMFAWWRTDAVTGGLQEGPEAAGTGHCQGLHWTALRPDLF